MKYLRKKYGIVIEIIDEIIHALAKINKLEFSIKIEALLLLRNLNFSYEESERCVDDLVKLNFYDFSLLNIIKRHLIMIRFNQNIEERKKFIQNWITNENYKNEDLFLQGTIIGMCTEDYNLLNESDLEKIKKLQKHRVKRTKSILSLCWLCKSLKLLGISEYDEYIFEKIMSSCELNGSWGNSLERTIKISTPLSSIDNFNKTELEKPYKYIIKRFEQGYETSLQFKFQFVKLANNLGKLNKELLAYIEKGINELSKTEFSNIREKLVNSEFDSVFDELQIVCSRKGMSELFINLKTRWTKNEKNKKLGVEFNEDYQIEYNKIVQSIEYLINLIEKKESFSE